MTEIIIKSAIVALCSYLIGSIPTGYIVVKIKTGKDIRQTGSGSMGATNVKRVLGTKWFFIILLLDGIKGIIPVCLTKLFLNDLNGFYPALSSLFTIIGHTLPIYIGFKGGKSVATGIGTIIGLNPIIGVVTALIWAILTYLTRYVSVGSIIAVLIAPLLMYFYNAPVYFFLVCIINAMWIICAHSANILRLIKGEENKVR